MGRGHCDFGSSARIFHSHAGNHKIDSGAADLTSKHVKTVEVHWLQRSELAPRGELGFNGECDQDVHQIFSDAALTGGDTKAKNQEKNAGLKTGHYKILGGVGHALGAAFRDVAVRFVPAHRTLERRGYRPRLKSQFTLGARAIHKHHVARDLDAFDWYARLAPDQPRKSRTRIGYT